MGHERQGVVGTPRGRPTALVQRGCGSCTDMPIKILRKSYMQQDRFKEEAPARWVPDGHRVRSPRKSSGVFVVA